MLTHQNSSVCNGLCYGLHEILDDIPWILDIYPMRYGILLLVIVSLSKLVNLYKFVPCSLYLLVAVECRPLATDIHSI